MQTQNQNTDYKPVSCDLSDELEAISIQKKSVQLKLRGDGNQTEWKTGKIIDLFTKDHADFMKLADGTIVRLDKILEWKNV